MLFFQQAYDMLKNRLKANVLDGSIGDYIFDGMIIDMDPIDDECDEFQDYIVMHVNKKYENINNIKRTFMIPCTKRTAKLIDSISNEPCMESTWKVFGICDGECSKANFDYWIQLGALRYSEGE